jgi:phosphohistidine phosphatase SixA
LCNISQRRACLRHNDLRHNEQFVPAEIYIFRHGIESRLPGAEGLSEQGIARVRRQARGLARMGVMLDVILAGNDQVSRDTAAALADGLVPRPRVIETPAFGPDGNVEDAHRELWDAASDIRIAAVGHEPVVGILAARLIGAQQPLIFKKAAGCRIDVDQGSQSGELRWFLPPRILRAIGRWA